MNIGIWILIGAAIIVIWFVTLYNRMVRLRNVRENAFANVDVYLRQRYDLVPQLVATVKGYAAHEKSTLERVIAARSRGLDAKSVSDKVKAAGDFSESLSRLLAVSERYPDLKANTNFMHLQTTLADIEDHLASVRSFFNMTTREYNTCIESFPALFVAGLGGFRREEMLPVTDAERAAMIQTPHIDFSGS